MHDLDFQRLVPPYVQGFESYQPSKPDQELMHAYGLTQLHRLNNNENSLGPPPEVVAALAQFSPQTVPIYPSGDSYYLRQKLADFYDKPANSFLVGNGSCEVISSVIKAFCEEGDNIITADRTFAVYEWVAEFSGLEARLIGLNDYCFDPQAMLAAMDERTKILFVCNPNNPTGTYWNRATMEAFLLEVNNRAIVVLDEAYFEYLDKDDFPDGMELMTRHANVIVFRTFSKMYALAALRIGYLCGMPEVVDIVSRAHIVYSVNTLAQKAAVAALANDGSFIRDTRAMVREAREQLVTLFERLGLEYVSHQGNFLMVRVPMPDTLMYRKLLAKGFLVRSMTSFRFPNWIRISLVPPSVMDLFCTAFTSVLESRGK